MVVSSKFRRVSRSVLLACVLGCIMVSAGFAGSAEAMQKLTFREKVKNIPSGVKNFLWPTVGGYFNRTNPKSYTGEEGITFLGTHKFTHKPLNGFGVPVEKFGGREVYTGTRDLIEPEARRWVYGMRTIRIGGIAAAPIVLGGLTWGLDAAHCGLFRATNQPAPYCDKVLLQG